ncbi:uncharacterized protein LOC100211700 isoform X4 [Hydra vulgaris]|uniref:Uncharacterized protein LOC100211700 isoform X4 n=1 Tax=Hydra vulgaris TaxID=6087 RepID=A0ABM4BYF3_HYDVU
MSSKILLLAAIVLVFCKSTVFSQQTPAATNPTIAIKFDNFMNQVKTKANEVKSIAEKSYKDNYGKLDQKIAPFRKELVAKDAELKDKADKSEKLSAAIEKVGGASVTLVKGIVNGNWQDLITGALGIIGGLAALAGPVGALISSILSVISMLFGLFGGSQEAEESQEAMLKRVIDEALTKARAEELKADGEGLKKLIMSIRNSLNQFRESEKITPDQANELYTQVFTGLTFFGKLKYEINKYCDCSIKDNSKIKEAKEKSSRCLEFINLYSDLSIYRMLLITDMTSLFSSVELNDTSNNLLLLLEKEQISDKDVIMFLFDPIHNHRQRLCISQYFGAPNKYPTIQAYSDLLKTVPKGKVVPSDVAICSSEELRGLCHKLDAKMFKANDLGKWSESIKSLFISDKLQVTGYSGDNEGAQYGPFYGPTVIGVLPGAWKSITVAPTDKHAQNMVRVCMEYNLDQGSRCDQLDVIDYPDLKKIHAFDGDVRAYEFISKGDYEDEKVSSNEVKCVFPFNMTFQDKNKVTIEKEYKHCTNEGDEFKRYWCATQVSQDRKVLKKGYCIPNGDIMTTKGYGKCKFPFIQDKRVYTYCTYGGYSYKWCRTEDSWQECEFDQSWELKIATLGITDKDQIEIFSEEGFEGDKIGPLYGPNVIDRICGEKNAKSIKVSYHNKNVSDMVKICNGESFSQYCDYLDVGKYGNITFHGCTLSGSEKIKSMTIPSGKKVELWTEYNYKGFSLGPYAGPVSMPVIDAGASIDTSYEVKSMEITNIELTKAVESLPTNSTIILAKKTKKHGYRKKPTASN